MSHDLFVVTDLHLFDAPLGSARDYPEEVFGYANSIQPLLEQSENPVLIFTGDIFHQAFKSFSSFVSCILLFMKLSKACDGHVYSVVGNHEFTYMRNNPFWLLSNINSDYVKSLGVHPDGSGVSPFINVCDEFIVDNVLISCAHYGRFLTEVNVPNDIGDIIEVSHNSIYTPEIINTLERKYHRDLALKYTSFSQIRDTGILIPDSRLKYLFTGHMHKAYSAFNVEETINGYDYNFYLRNLGSFGRTNHTEYDNTDLQRCIPKLKLSNGKVIEYTEISVQLLKREEVVDEDLVLQKQEVYKERKSFAALRNIKYNTEDPIDSLRNQLGSSPSLQGILNSAVSGELPLDFIQLCNSILQ